MKTKPLAIILISLLRILNFLFVIPAKAESNTIYVCPSGCEYFKIQEAVDAAISGTTIIVKDGIYSENIKVGKENLIIKSENGPENTLLQPLPGDYLFYATASNIVLEGFTIKGSVLISNNSILRKNKIINAGFCVSVNGSDNLIVENEIRECYIAISIYGDRNTIFKNSILNNKLGIDLDGSYLSTSPSHNTIYLNNFENNEQDVYIYFHSSQIDNIFHSRQKLTYLYKNKIFTSYLGNFWSSYNEEDRDGNGVIDKEYTTSSQYSQPIFDFYSLKEPFENYSILREPRPYVEVKRLGEKVANFSKIQDAINFAFPGDEILIHPGTYYENLTIDKDFLIITSEKGPKETVIQSDGITIRSDYVVVKGLTLGETPVASSRIYLENSSHSYIFDNIIKNASTGMYLSSSTQNFILNNEILNCSYGIYLANSQENIISQNKISSSSISAIEIQSGDYNKIFKNEISQNNNGVNLDGYWLSKSPSYTTIYLNNFLENNLDAYIYFGSSQVDNLFNSREQFSYSFQGNSFINFLGNYWKSYRGEDSDGNGIGDDPYLFSPPWSQLIKDDFPLTEPFENYQTNDFWFFDTHFQYLLGGNKKRGFVIGNVTLSNEKLKIEGQAFLEVLPSQIPQIQLIITKGTSEILITTLVSPDLISFNEISQNIYYFSAEIQNPPQPLNGGHYELYLEISGNPFFIETNSRINQNYLPLARLLLSSLLISEVYYNVSRGEEPDNEWLIVYNTTDDYLDISGWQICDEKSCDELNPQEPIPPKSFAIITSEESTFNLWEIPEDMVKILLKDKTIGRGLNNDGDAVFIKRGEEIIDALSYGKSTQVFNPPCPSVDKGYSLIRISLERDTDTCTDFTKSLPTLKPKITPPIPVINFFPKNPARGVKVKFDASSSRDDGKITKFEWQIGTSTFTGTTTEFTFNENGEYQITLTATDNDDATSSTSTIIKVEPFSFAIVTDLHIGRGYPDYDGPGFDDGYNGEEYYLTQRLRNVVKWINENKDKIQCDNATCSIKFLVVLGDIADSGEKSEFLKAKEILDELNNYHIPYVPVFGNHDVWPHTDESEATTTLGEDYFDEIFWDENATNTKLMKEILNWERDENYKNYKNFAFNYGGINFIGLDFNSREPFMKFGKGVGADAVLNEINKEWLEKKLEELKGEPVILLAHHPLIFDPINAFSFTEFPQLENLLKDNITVFFDFAGHIHSFEEFWGKWPENANIKYPTKIHPYTPGNLPVITTEALMVGSNGRGVATSTPENSVVGDKKGIVRIVKVFDKNSINPYNWETTEKDIQTEFLAFNPSLNLGFSIRRQFNSIPCVELEAHKFSEKPCDFLWNFGGKISSVDCNSDFSECLVCYEEAGQYTITLFAKDKNSNFSESISKKITVNEAIIPRTIKKSAELIEKGIEFISEKTQMSFDKIGQAVKDKVKIFKKKSPAIPVGEIIVHFENLKEDLDLSSLIADTDFKTRKSILHMENWPNEVERSKILFLPKK